MNHFAKHLIQLLMMASLAAPVHASIAPYLFDVLKKPTYRESWTRLLSQSRPVPDWLSRFSRTYDGVATPAEPLKVGGADFEAYSVCKPHDCADNWLQVVFPPGGAKAWGVLVEDGHPGRLLGNPDAEMTAALNRILNANR